MAAPLARMLVYVSDRLACVRIVGRANFTSSIEFKTLINELIEKGYSCFALDLSECALMDSTFLGVLAGLGLKLATPANGAESHHGIDLLNPNPRIADLLENLGILHLFQVINGPAPVPSAALASPSAPSAAPTHEEITRNCLEAHELLMAVSPANIPKFKDVAKFLAEDLRKPRPDA
jgi:anti-sigma B factor antagonist